VTTSNTPPRVLYCESNVDGTIGGSHFCLLYLVENLDRTAFTPIVVFYEDHALIARFKATAETRILPRADPTQWGFAAARRAVNVVRFVRRVFARRSFLKQNQIALLHQNNSVTRHHDWMLAALIAGVPYIAHERGFNTRYSWLARALSRRAALVIPVSRAIMSDMTARGVPPGNIRVLYDGLDPERVKPARSPEALRQEYGVGPAQPVIGIVGNIRAWKGQETVVRALIQVLKVHPDTVCFFVGSATEEDAAYKDRLGSIIRENGMEKRVRFTGYQSDPASFVNMLSVVIHASVRPEPFGMVVLEAMAQRKPVVGSRAGGVVETVVDGQTGYTFAPGDADELARRLIELLNDPARAARMGERGYARLLESFTVAHYMNGIHSVYRAVLDRKPIPSAIGIPSESSTVTTH
jgi:glycosyltransferase involved in cell wall biosynthesis